MDLFTPVVPAERFHPYFAGAKKYPNPDNDAVLNEWAEGFFDRDGKLVTEFQTTYHSAYWELYLFAVLKEMGCPVDFTHSSPDFVVTGPEQFCMEATVALNAQESVPEVASIDHDVPDDLDVFFRSAFVRWANSITTKSSKYLTSYAVKDHVKHKPFVLAVAAFDQPYACLEFQRPAEAVLFEQYVNEEKHLRDGTVPRPEPLTVVLKENGAPIRLGFFNRDEFAHISAVVINVCAGYGKVIALNRNPNENALFLAAYYVPGGLRPREVLVTKQVYREHLLDGLRVFHNPHATLRR